MALLPRRKRKAVVVKFTLLALLMVSIHTSLLLSVRSDERAVVPGPAHTAISLPATVDEARSRARLLHETINGTLQVIHRDFFNEDDSHAIPSASLEDVFKELAKTYDVQLRWLIVNTDVLNFEHKPVDDFENLAIEALSKGQPSFESVELDRYRYVGSIRLASQCLKCHVKDRTSTEDRAAGLMISMPFQRQNP